MSATSIMKFFLLAVAASTSLALGQTTGKLGNAAITENNPSQVAYVATFPTGNGIQGQIEGVSDSNGTGVSFNINFFNFPDASEGPFRKQSPHNSYQTFLRYRVQLTSYPPVYHIHVDPIPPSGDCAATLGDLDPYERGDSPPCDASQPATCEVGDLSGKHGEMSPEADSGFQAAYLELYISTEPGLNSFFGNRSIVIHSHNLTRLACANFKLAVGSPTPSPVSGGSVSSTAAAATTTTASSSATAASSTAGSSSTASGSSASASASSKGGAVMKIVNSGAVLAGIAGFMAFAL
jgi:hypothetical protein